MSNYSLIFPSLLPPSLSLPLSLSFSLSMCTNTSPLEELVESNFLKEVFFIILLIGNIINGVRKHTSLSYLTLSMHIMYSLQIEQQSR